MDLWRNLKVGDSKHLKRLKEVNIKPVEGIETFFIDKKLYVSKKFLAKFYGVNEMAINKWEKSNGLKRTTKGHPKLILYDFDYVINFRAEMVGKSKGNPKDNKGHTKDRDMEGKEYAEVDLQKKKNEVILQDIKIKEAKGDLVPSDVADKSIAEFGALFVGFLRNSRMTLSRDLENLNQDNIFSFLDHHYGEFVKDVDNRVNKLDDDKLNTLFDKIMELE